MAYDFHTAMLRRLGAIQEAGVVPQPQNTLYKLQQQKQMSSDYLNGGGETGNTFNSFRSAISAQESGGNYSARNSSSGAMGKYQIMPSNLGGKGSGWDYEALGVDITPQQFLSSPDLQEKIASFKLKQYYDKYGPAGAAVAWYAGPGAVAKSSNSTASQGAYPSISAYKNSILRKMGLA